VLVGGEQLLPVALDDPTADEHRVHVAGVREHNRGRRVGHRGEVLSEVGADEDHIRLACPGCKLSRPGYRALLAVRTSHGGDETPDVRVTWMVGGALGRARLTGAQSTSG